MKNALKTVNNIVTYECTISALNIFKDIFEFNDFEKIKSDIDNTPPNANGYDIQIEEDDSNGKNIIAEVKCNNPFEKKANQVNLNFTLLRKKGL